MKRLTVALLLSILFHLALGLSILFFLNRTLRPLAGGGGGEVSVEIVGEEESASGGRSSKLEARPSPHMGPTRKPRDVEQRPPGAEPSRRRAGLGAGEGSGIGSGPTGGTSAVLAEIRARIERAKRYPLLARKMGITGISLVRFQIDASGRPASLSLKSSSGQRILDDEALATIQRAAPYPAYPDPLEIGIHFLLEN